MTGQSGRTSGGISGARWVTIFLSWSGKTSFAIAQALHEWLHAVLPHAEPWLSARSIRYGERWNSRMSQQFAKTDCGIICLVGDNVTEPWIHFEAGAISQAQVGRAIRVIPLVFGLGVGRLPATLSQFQVAKYERSVLSRLVRQLNKASERPIDSEKLENALAVAWPGLDSRVKKILSARARQVRRRPLRKGDKDVVSGNDVASRRAASREPRLGSRGWELMRRLINRETVEVRKGGAGGREAYRVAEDLVRRGLVRWGISFEGRTNRLYLTKEGRALAIGRSP